MLKSRGAIRPARFAYACRVYWPRPGRRSKSTRRPCRDTLPTGSCVPEREVSVLVQLDHSHARSFEPQFGKILALLLRARLGEIPVGIWSLPRILGPYILNPETCAGISPCPSSGSDSHLLIIGAV